MQKTRLQLGRRTIVTTIVIWALIMLALVGGTHLRQVHDDTQLSPEPLAAVDPPDADAAVTASGTLHPAEIVPVEARTAGVLIDILVEPGDEVQQGQVLALIDPEVQQLEVQSARLILEQLQNRVPEREMNLRSAEAELMRMDERIRSGIAVDQDLDQARRALLDARASLQSLQLDMERSRADLQLAEMQLSRTQIVAPMTGTVLSIEAREDSIPGTPDEPPVVLQIADLSRLTIEAFVTEADIAKLGPDTTAWFTTPGSGARRYDAILRRIDPRPRGRGRLEFSARLDVDNLNRNLRPGMSVQVYFDTTGTGAP